jgi:hypothetical protein
MLKDIDILYHKLIFNFKNLIFNLKTSTYLHVVYTIYICHYVSLSSKSLPWNMPSKQNIIIIIAVLQMSLSFVKRYYMYIHYHLSKSFETLIQTTKHTVDVQVQHCSNILLRLNADGIWDFLW